jgi:hypothetical protein
MRTAILVLTLLVPSVARADDLYMNPNDPGKVTHIERGVWELDVGGLGVLTNDSDSGASVTRLSTDFSGQVHYFLKDNLSVGAEALFDYDSVGAGNDSITFGGAVDAAVHLRLGLGAFFRPGIAIGALVGNRNTMVAAGTLAQASEVAFVTRLQLPIAYFASRRFLLQAGPQLNVQVGSYTPMGADAVSFTRIAGGFAVGVGYAF